MLFSCFSLLHLQGKGKGKGKGGKGKSADSGDQQKNDLPKLRCLDVFSGCGGKFSFFCNFWNILLIPELKG